MALNYDFSGWATKADLLCSDGRTIRRGAFSEQDGTIVPLVWNHQHKEPNNVLGHALLEDRPEGMYAYCSFNDTAAGQQGKNLVVHGDVTQLSIYANQLRQSGGDVMHGKIREVSLVLAGANPGASIDNVLAHGFGEDDEGIIYTGEQIYLSHDGIEDYEDEDYEDEDEMSLEDVIDTLDDEQYTAFATVVAGALGLEDEDIEHSMLMHSEYDDEDSDEPLIEDVLDTFTPEQLDALDLVVDEILDEQGFEHSDYVGEYLYHGEVEGDTVEEIIATFNEDQMNLLKIMVGAVSKGVEHTDVYSDYIYHADEEDDGPTVQEVYDTLTEKQKQALAIVVGAAAELDDEDSDESEGGNDDMRHNLFDTMPENDEGEVLSHSEMAEIFRDAQTYGSLKEAVLAHGITEIDYLFPEARNISTTPDFIKREDEWVKGVMNGVHKTPFSRVRSIHANITEDEARAKGYLKGERKIEEVFGLLRRSTDPQTVYKKQELDRDDVIDITDFDVVSWLKTEMRGMLDEELARAILIGDGRSTLSKDKIQENHIRPIWTDDALYTINKTYTAVSGDESATAKAFMKACVKARKEYKGTGNPAMYCTEDILTEMLLIEDTTGRVIYDTVDKLATYLRVSKIITVPVMENQTRTVNSQNRTLTALIVNLNDYNVGADKGGSVNMFDDFDIDYNKQKYLIETRMSGALTKPYSAIAVECAG